MTTNSQTARLRRRLESITGVPATAGNTVEVLRNGDEIFPAMLDAIRASERSIDLTTFVYWTGDIAVEFAEALAERARAGVRVRVLLDAVGARRIKDDLVQTMTDAGVVVHWFRPVTDGSIGEAVHRTHRKILVCDELVGFTGGVGIAQEWTGDARNPDEWRDTHFRLTGPAVDGLRGAFYDNWLETVDRLEFDEADTFPIPDGSGESHLQVLAASAAVAWSPVTTVLEAAITLAEQQVLITTAYFNPDDRLQDLLVSTAERGVTVEVLVPGPHADKRFVQLASEAVYERLLRAGVKIQCFQPSMLHAKVITIDRSVAIVGSPNINNRSMIEDDEVVLVVSDPDVVAILDGHRAGDVCRATEIDLTQWEDRSVLQRTQEAVAGLVEDLL